MTKNVWLILAGLGHAGAGTLTDITRCPGADTCNLAITHSRGLAAALEELFSSQTDWASDPGLSGLCLKISGCPNSCGQHHIADIGFYGSARIVDGKAVPHYRLLVGGTTAEGQATFGMAVATIPAKRVPEAVRHLLNQYRQTRQEAEQFRLWLGRMGPDRLKADLARFAEIPSYAEDPGLYEDLGTPGEFKVQTGKGECAA
jgi:ferredoxin-nitrite reductase/sulfite reductase (ferredoxin)